MILTCTKRDSAPPIQVNDVTACLTHGGEDFFDQHVVGSYCIRVLSEGWVNEKVLQLMHRFSYGVHQIARGRTNINDDDGSTLRVDLDGFGCRLQQELMCRATR